MMWSNRAHLFAENFDARLAGIVIWPDCPLFEKKSRGPSNPWTSTKFAIYVFKNPGACFFEGAEAPQAAATQPQRAWGPWNRWKLTKFAYIRIKTRNLQNHNNSENGFPEGQLTRRKGLVFYICVDIYIYIYIYICPPAVRGPWN